MTSKLLGEASDVAYYKMDCARLELVGCATAWRAYRDIARCNDSTEGDTLRARIAEGVLRQRVLEYERAQMRWQMIAHACDMARRRERDVMARALAAVAAVAS